MSGLLEIQGLRKSIDGTPIVNGFDLDVTELTVCCVVGPNGAGKTTTMDLITGRQKPTAGTIRFAQEDITGLDEHQIARRGIGRKFQVPAVFRELTVRQNLSIAYSHTTSVIKTMFAFRDAGLRTKLDEVLPLSRLADRLDVTAGLLSHGETQWLEISMVLMQNPRVLLLDEPVAGLTEQEVEQIAAMIKALKQTHTLIVVEHDMGFVREIADVVIVMHMGALLARGSIRDIESNERVREVYLGKDEH